MVSGASIGAIVGALFAEGNLSRLESLAEEMDWQQSARLFLEAGLPRSGLIGGRNVRRLLRDLMGNARIESLPLPFAAVATDLRTDEEVVLDAGGLVEAVWASISLPGIFAPKCREGRWLIDGGLVNPVPVNLSRALGAEFVIAVEVNLNEGAPDARTGEARDPRSRDLLESLAPGLSSYFARLQRRLSGGCGCFRRRASKPRKGTRDEPNIFEVLTRTLRIAENSITRLRLKSDPADLLIQPAVSRIGTLEFHRAEEAIEAGRRAVEEQAEAIARLTRKSRR